MRYKHYWKQIILVIKLKYIQYYQIFNFAFQVVIIMFYSWLFKVPHTHCDDNLIVGFPIGSRPIEMASATPPRFVGVVQQLFECYNTYEAFMEHLNLKTVYNTPFIQDTIEPVNIINLRLALFYIECMKLITTDIYDIERMIHVIKNIYYVFSQLNQSDKGSANEIFINLARINVEMKDEFLKVILNALLDYDTRSIQGDKIFNISVDELNRLEMLYDFRIRKVEYFNPYLNNYLYDITQTLYTEPRQTAISFNETFRTLDVPITEININNIPQHNTIINNLIEDILRHFRLTYVSLGIDPSLDFSFYSENTLSPQTIRKLIINIFLDHQNDYFFWQHLDKMTQIEYFMFHTTFKTIVTERLAHISFNEAYSIKVLQQLERLLHEVDYIFETHPLLNMREVFEFLRNTDNIYRFDDIIL